MTERSSSGVACVGLAVVSTLALAATVSTAQAKPTRSAMAAPDCRHFFGYAAGGAAPAFGISAGSAVYQGKSVAGAGTVEVRSSCDDTSVQSLQLPHPHAGDQFGASLTAVNRLNDDEYTDLVVGVPGYDVGTHKDAGAVAFFLGSPTGLKYWKTLTQSSDQVPGHVQAGAHFGAAISTNAATLEDDDSRFVVRIGEPGKDVGTAVDTGGVVDLTFRHGDGAFEPSTSRQYTLDTSGIPGKPLSGDNMGASLFRTTYIGLPGRTVSGHAGAGAVLVGDRLDVNQAYAPRIFTQDSPGIAGTAETGDHFGAAVTDGWVGVPDEDSGGLSDVGVVQEIEGAHPTGRMLSQNSPGIPGSAEAGDRFGASLSTVYEDFDDSQSTHALLIGVPGEDTTHGIDAGSVNIVPEDGDAGQTSDTSPALFSGPHPGGRLGAALGPALQTGRRGGGATIGEPGTDTVYRYSAETAEASPTTLVFTRTDLYHRRSGTGNKGYGESISSYDGFN